VCETKIEHVSTAESLPPLTRELRDGQQRQIDWFNVAQRDDEAQRVAPRPRCRTVPLRYLQIHGIVLATTGCQCFDASETYHDCTDSQRSVSPGTETVKTLATTDRTGTGHQRHGTYINASWSYARQRILAKVEEQFLDDS